MEVFETRINNILWNFRGRKDKLAYSELEHMDTFCLFDPLVILTLAHISFFSPHHTSWVHFPGGKLLLGSLQVPLMLPIVQQYFLDSILSFPLSDDFLPNQLCCFFFKFSLLTRKCTVCASWREQASTFWGIFFFFFLCMNESWGDKARFWII